MTDGPPDRGWALAVRDANPPAPIYVWRGAAQVATVGMFVILLLVALDQGRPILLPIAAAFVVTMMLGPLAARADRHGVPPIVTTIVLWLLVMGAFYGLIMLLSAPAVHWIGKAPDIGRSIQDKLHVLDRPLNAMRDLRNALVPGDAGKGFNVDLMAIVQPVVSVATPALAQLLIFFGTLFFMLLGRNPMRQALVHFFHRREARLRCLRIMNDIEHNLTSYLSVVTMINICVGIGAGVVAWAVGLPDPLAWGVLGFVLNFIPYVGALIIEISMFMVGLVTFPSITYALIAPLAYLAMGTAEGHFITPSILGHKFTLSPLTVFLSLVFWTWLWGPLGAFLAAPFVLIGMVVVMHLMPKHEPALPD